MKRSTNEKIFIDTSGFYAILVARDDQHKKATSILKQAAKKRRALVTTDYILDEIFTLLKARGLGYLVAQMMPRLQSSNACVVEWMDSQRFNAAYRMMTRYHDKTWSFTDCFSFLLMKELKIRKALTKDRHFSEAGFEVMLK